MADELKQALLEFLQALRAEGIAVFLAGGYGLYLKQIALLESDVRTYLDRNAWPRPRATADLDVFLPTEVIVDHKNMARVRGVLDALGYQPIMKHLHFTRQGPLGPVRIELLTGPIESSEAVKVSDFRVRARRFPELHAYLTREAIDLERNPVELTIERTTVLIPNSFSFLLMKLHAFRDRINAAHDDQGRQLGRHHALDVYRLVAMLTEPDESFVRSRCAAHGHVEPVRAAATIVRGYFAEPTSVGVLRLREHSLAGEHLQIASFLDLLGDLFRGCLEP